MPTSLTPEETRRPDVPAHPVRLADGRVWGLALPSLRLVPVIASEDDPMGRPTESIAVGSLWSYPPEIGQLLDTAKAALEGNSRDAVPESFFALASALLRQGHDIDPPTAAALLAVEMEDLPRLAEEVFSVALGVPLPTPSPSLGGELP